MPDRKVAPLAGAWIEIPGTFDPKVTTYVAPLAGAWIEITGQKSYIRTDSVAPLAGAWIEMIKRIAQLLGDTGRSPCGSVD